MACGYCGIAVRQEGTHCVNCGAPLAAPCGEAALYERIGRAVMDRLPPDAQSGDRRPNDLLDRIVGIGERKDASDRERMISRMAKGLFLVIVIWQVPMILMMILPFAFLFLFWVYLPYRGLRALLSWLSS